MRLQRNVDTDVRRDVIPFNSRGAAASPLACQVKVICALSTDVTLADVILVLSDFVQVGQEFVLSG